jgi:hypothetical protein
MKTRNAETHPYTKAPCRCKLCTSFCIWCRSPRTYNPFSKWFFSLCSFERYCVTSSIFSVPSANEKWLCAEQTTWSCLILSGTYDKMSWHLDFFLWVVRDELLPVRTLGLFFAQTSISSSIVCFLGTFHSREKRLLPSSCPSVRPHVSVRLSLHGFPSCLLLGT